MLNCQLHCFLIHSVTGHDAVVLTIQFNLVLHSHNWLQLFLNTREYRLSLTDAIHKIHLCVLS
jgi:hypothetical protein